MAQIQSQSQLQEFLQILRRRSWQVILPAAFIISIGSAVAVIVPKKFEVKTTIELRNTEAAELSTAAQVAPFQIKSRVRISKVVDELNWVDYLALDPAYRAEYLEDINEDIRVWSTKGGEDLSSFVTIEYKDVNPRRAKEFLLALRDAWVKNVLDRGRNQAIADEQKLLEAKNDLLKRYQKEEQALTERRRRHNISATQPSPGTGQPRTEDPVFDRRNDNQRRLDELSIELIGLEVQVDQAEEQYVDIPEMISKEELIENDSMENDLREIDKQIRRMKVKLEGIRPSHSQYAVYERDLADLERQREVTLRGVTETELLTTLVPNPARVEMRRKIDQLKLIQEQLAKTKITLEDSLTRDERKIAELQEVYREIRESQERIERLQMRLTETDKRYEEKRQLVLRLSTPQGNPFEITQDPFVPRKPTEPNPWLIVAFSVVLGLGLGVGTAVMAEFSRSCFRSVNDISHVLMAPVLGTVNTIVTRAESRRKAMRRMVIGISSATLIGALVFVTWAWAYNPDLLTQDLREAIEGLRASLR